MSLRLSFPLLHAAAPSGLVLAVLLTLASPVRALTEAGFLSELPLILTPSRLLQPINEAPAAVTVIDRDLIKASGYRNIARLMRLVPGMQVGQERGSLHWVTYHGLGNDNPSQMQVLIDGRSIYSPGTFNSVDWSGLNIDIDEIDRIEVVRGSNSAAYGSNAFLGVINIITRHSSVESGFRFSASGGDSGIGDVSIEQGWRFDDFSMRLNAAAKGDHGFDDLHDSRRTRLIALRADQRLGVHDELSMRLSASQIDKQLGYPNSSYDNNAERDAHGENTSLHLQWRHTPDAEHEWLWSFYRNEEDTRESWFAQSSLPQLTPPTQLVPLNRNRNSTRTNLELQYRQFTAPDLSWLGGLELRRDEIYSPFLFYNAAHQNADLLRVFAQVDWKMRPQLKLNASLLAEKFDYDKTRLSPRLFFNWSQDPGVTWRAGYARVWGVLAKFTSQGDVRAYYDGALLAHPFIPNLSLRPERVDSLELGYLKRWRLWDARLDMRLFNERITDFTVRVVQPRPAVGAPLLYDDLPSARYENLNVPITLRGFEYQLELHPDEGSRWLFSHTVIDRRSDNNQVTRITSPYTASLSWLQQWPQQWRSTISVLRMGPITGGTGFVANYGYTAPAYTTVDARIARTLRFGGEEAEVALTAINLGGRHQEIPDQSQQAVVGAAAANEASPMLWLTFSLRAH